MSSISFIGLGGMARAIAARAVEGGNAVEVIGRDQAKAKDLAAALGGDATAGTFGTAPAGDIVILAVPYASAVPTGSPRGAFPAPDSWPLLLEVKANTIVFDQRNMPPTSSLPSSATRPAPSGTTPSAQRRYPFLFNFFLSLNSLAFAAPDTKQASLLAI